MEERAQRESKGVSERTGKIEADYTSALQAIDLIIERASREKLDTEEAQLRFLCYWWSKTYSRPLKDPLLQSYTLEELYYEFKEHSEREKAAKERVEQEADNIEQAKYDEAAAWAEAEEKKESTLKEGPIDWQPSDEDKSWMEDQIRSGKEIYGEDFGEDINEDF